MHISRLELPEARQLEARRGPRTLAMLLQPGDRVDDDPAVAQCEPPNAVQRGQGVGSRLLRAGLAWRIPKDQSGLRLRREVWIMSGSRRKPGPLGPFVEGYRAWLVRRGYSPSVAIRSLGHAGASGPMAGAQRARGRSAHRTGGARPSRRVPERPRPVARRERLPLVEYLRADGAVRAEPPSVSRRLSGWSASIASGCFVSGGWRGRRSAAASSSLVGSSPTRWRRVHGQ